MTVSVSYTPHSYHPGSAMAAESLASLPFFATDELIVTHEAALTGVRTVLVEDSGYSIGGLASGGGLSTAATITALAVWPVGDFFHVERLATLRQDASWGAFEHPPAADVVKTLDRTMLGVQEARELAGRGFVVPLNPASVVGKFATVDADGAPAFASGTGADAGLRTDLAATGGAALVKANAVRSVLLKLSEEWWIGDFPGGDATTKLQYGVAQGVRTIRVPATTTVLEAKTTQVAPLKIAGVHKMASKISAPLVNDFLFENTIALDPSLRGFSACDLEIEMSRANPLSGIFNLFDNGNHPLERLQLRSCSRQAITMLLGVGHIVRDVRIADAGRGVTGSGTGVTTAAVEFIGDGSGVIVEPYCEKVYVTFCGTGIRFYRCTDFTCIGSTTEYGNAYGFGIDSSNGLFAGNFQEGSLTGGGLFHDSDVRSIGNRTIASPANWVRTWAGVAGEQRMHFADEPLLCSATRSTEFTPAGTTMAVVPLEATGDNFFVTRSGNRLTATRGGQVGASGEWSILNTDAGTQYATVSLVRYPVAGGGPVEVPRSTRHIKLLAGQFLHIKVEEQVSLTLGDGLELWFGASATTVRLKAEPGGAPAIIGGVAVAPVCASLSINPTSLTK